MNNAFQAHQNTPVCSGGLRLALLFKETMLPDSYRDSTALTLASPERE